MSKVYITDFFQKKYVLKIKWFDILRFAEKLKTYSFINLKHPYFKFKFYLFWIAYRWVVIITKSWNIIPIILCFKKDKNCGENIIWEKFEKQILGNQNKAVWEIEKGNYLVY